MIAISRRTSERNWPIEPATECCNIDFKVNECIVMVHRMDHCPSKEGGCLRCGMNSHGVL